MEIFGHIIKDEEIIGIAPLYAQRHTDPVMVSLYNAFRFSFEVHCKQTSIKIESEYFFTDKNPAETIKAEDWKKKYFDHRANLVDLLELPKIDF